MNGDSNVIYVIDTETTGLSGYPHDHVVDIGICSVNLELGTVDEVFSSIVGHDVDDWDYPTRNAWIFNNTDLTVDQVANAPDISDVVSEVRDFLKNEYATSFNVGFDFGKFLHYEPWNIDDYILKQKCIMLSSVDICKIPAKYGRDGYKWPKLQEAYDIITRDDPAGINGRQTHRAMSDAVMASHILIELYRRGAY